MNRKDWEEQVFESDLNPTARMICMAIGSHGSWEKSQTVWPSRQRISSMTGVSRETVGKYMAALEEHGWLKVVKIRKDNVREYELSKPQVVPTLGILAVKPRGHVSNLKRQVVPVLDNLDSPDESQVAPTLDKQVVQTDDEVVPVLDKQVVQTDGLGCLELGQEPTKNLPVEPTIEPTKTSTTADAAVHQDEDDRLGEVAMFSRVEQVESCIQGLRNLSLTSEEKKQVRELALNPQWFPSESRPNYRTQEAIKEVLG